MNVLFIGPYRQTDGWGLAAKDYIKSISTVSNIKLSTRPIYLAAANADENFSDYEILNYEKNHSDNYDLVIQKVLPEHLFYDSRFGKNVGLFTLEISNLSNTNVIKNINRMDEIWVPSQIEKQSLIASGCIKPIKVISQALDINKLIPQNKIIFDNKVDNSFKFYTIGENVFRKNFEDLIISYHLEFNLNDNVALIIKTSKQTKLKELQDFEKNIKSKLGLSKQYKLVIFITSRLTDQQILDFHYSCDCFVSSSYGEAFCRPAAEALCLGKNPIVNKNTGMKDFINDENGFLVNSTKDPVMVPNNPIHQNKDYYNANQYWYKINKYDLMANMRKAYNMYTKDNKKWKAKSEIGIASKNKFNYENIGKLCIQDI